MIVLFQTNVLPGAFLTTHWSLVSFVHQEPIKVLPAVECVHCVAMARGPRVRDRPQSRTVSVWLDLVIMTSLWQIMWNFKISFKGLTNTCTDELIQSVFFYNVSFILTDYDLYFDANVRNVPLTSLGTKTSILFWTMSYYNPRVVIGLCYNDGECVGELEASLTPQFIQGW